MSLRATQAAGATEFGPVPIPADASAPSTVRGLLETIDEHLDGVRPDAELLLSELATNVVRHTDCPALAVMICLNGSSVRFAVSDCEPDRVPEFRATGAQRAGGFGLRIIDQVARDWGTEVDPFGKAVWFELSRGA